jgi:hypothetical protein
MHNAEVFIKYTEERQTLVFLRLILGFLHMINTRSTELHLNWNLKTWVTSDSIQLVNKIKKEDNFLDLSPKFEYILWNEETSLETDKEWLSLKTKHSSSTQCCGGDEAD